MSDRVQDRSPAEEDAPLRRIIGRKLLLVHIIGDILGAGVYALTGKVAGKVGGLVRRAGRKYPKAAGAALYTNKAFGVPFLTFIEVSGLLVIITIGAVTVLAGDGDASRLTESTPEGTESSSVSSAARPWPSSPSSGSRTRSTWPRRSTSRTRRFPGPSSSACS